MDVIPKFRIPKFEIQGCSLAALTILIVTTMTAPAEAKLAVFVDGRVLKVEDARLEGDRIVLDLKGGGTLRVSALRIDRVIADEVEDSPTPDLPDGSDCPASWADQELPAATPYKSAITEAARAADLHPWLVAAVVQAESAFNPDAVSRAGASGLMQLMPAAAADRGVTDVLDPVQNLRGGSTHLRICSIVLTP